MESAEAPNELSCAGGTAPGFLGTHRHDWLGVDLGQVLCQPGPNGTLAMDWSVESLSMIGLHHHPDRKHLLELHVTGTDGKHPTSALGFRTTPPRIWPLTAEQRLVLVVLGQQYILRAPHPQPLTRQQAADQLKELRPGENWKPKRVERVVSRVRHTLSKRGVRGLTREEVGEPVGNSLNHNLLTELAVTTETLKSADLALLGDIE